MIVELILDAIQYIGVLIARRVHDKPNAPQGFDSESEIAKRRNFPNANHVQDSVTLGPPKAIKHGNISNKNRFQCLVSKEEDYQGGILWSILVVSRSQSRYIVLQLY